MIDLFVSAKGIEAVNQQLSAINSPITRKKAIRAIARQIRKNSIKRMVRQTNVDGSAFKEHARGRKRKMLKKLSRLSKVIEASEKRGEIGWHNSFHSNIAAKHHFGFTQKMTKAALAKADEAKEKKKKKKKGDKAKEKSEDEFVGASRRQAKALIEVGYKVKKANGRGYTTPSIKWITQNMHTGRAGPILRALRGGAKSEWDTVLPPRQFLGLNQNEIPALLAIIKDVVIKEKR